MRLVRKRKRRNAMYNVIKWMVCCSLFQCANGAFLVRGAACLPSPSLSFRQDEFPQRVCYAPQQRPKQQQQRRRRQKPGTVLYGQNSKDPYRLGVFSYRNKEKQQQQQQQQQDVTPLLAAFETTNVTHRADNHDNTTTTTTTTDEDFVVSNPSETPPLKIVDFVPSKKEEEDKQGNETRRSSSATAITANETIQTTTKEGMKSSRKPILRGASSSSSLQPFFSSWSGRNDDKSLLPKVNKNITTMRTTTTTTKRHHRPTDVIVTVADLEEILQSKGYLSIRRHDDDNTQPPPPTTQKKKKNVAFPQESVLSYKGLTIGSTTCAGMLGMMLGMTVAPNLWLLGALLGSVYGYEISKNYQHKKQPQNILSKSIIYLGRKCAKAYLRVYDAVYGIWFMYKTGQLSYDYYKQYSKLDERFGIQEKMDAWNARFVQGKKQFDEWERQHEIGRRVLAGFRTAWLVEERRRKQTRYRIVQYADNVRKWCRRFVSAVWDVMTGGGSSSLREVLKGIRINISEARMQEIGPRIGASVMALVTVSMVGSVYAIAPRLLGLLAIAMGVIWPTWAPELWDRVQLLVAEFAATGRGETVDLVDGSATRTGIPTLLSQQFGLYDKKRYYYYQRQDGSRRWYRTGQPAFRSSDANARAAAASSKKKRRSAARNSVSSSAGRDKPKGPQWGWFS